jgi:hypothetical protein
VSCQDWEGLSPKAATGRKGSSFKIVVFPAVRSSAPLALVNLSFEKEKKSLLTKVLEQCGVNEIGMCALDLVSLNGNPGEGFFKKGVLPNCSKKDFIFFSYCIF